MGQPQGTLGCLLSEFANRRCRLMPGMRGRRTGYRCQPPKMQCISGRTVVGRPDKPCKTQQPRSQTAMFNGIGQGLVGNGRED